MTEVTKQQWQSVCQVTDLVLNSGVCALVHEGTAREQQIALFYLKDSVQQVFAISNFDPFGKANVLHRGLLGSSGEQAFVASPLYKQRFLLDSGACLDSDEQSVDVYPARVSDGFVELMV